MIEQSLRVVKPGGVIVLADIRSYPLMHAFHTSVQHYKAIASTSIQELKHHIDHQLQQETEFFVDPEFFVALKDHYPAVSQVQVRLQRGHEVNELMKYRYTVLLHVETDKPTVTATERVNGNGMTVEAIGQRLQQEQMNASSDVLCFSPLANSRLSQDMNVVEQLSDPQMAHLTVAQLETRTPTSSTEQTGGVDPEHLHQLAMEWGYRVELCWSVNSNEGHFDAVFVPLTQDRDTIVLSPLSQRQVRSAQWQRYSNNPLSKQQHQQLVPQLKTYVAERLPDYMVPASWVVLSQLPLTPNGKVDRNGLPAPETSGISTEYVAPQTPTEMTVAQIWADVLGIEKVGVDDNFFDLGGHSLLATQVMSRVQQTFNVTIALRQLFEGPTVRELADEVCGAQHSGLAMDEAYRSIPLADRGGPLPLSFAQQRLWFLEKMGLTGNAYHMPLALHMKGQLDRPTLQTSLNQLVARHEPLRTRFEEQDGTPIQRIDAPFTVDLALIDLSLIPPEQQAIDLHAQLQQINKHPFNLETEPPIRAQLFALSETDHVLLILLHHIASDGWSLTVLTQDLSALYKAALLNHPSGLSPLPIQYADFALWQRQWLQAEALETQLSYWKTKLQQLTPLQLSTDHPRPAVETFNGAGATIELSAALSTQLKQLAQQSDATLFMVLLAGFKVLLSRYTGQDSIAVGSPIANRNRPEIEGLIGFFVNSLVMHTDVSGNPSFTEVLSRVRQTALEAYAHQDVPFEKLVEELQPERSLNRHPLFQVMFAIQQQEILTSNFSLPNLEVGWYQEAGADITTRFDIEVHLWPHSDGIKGLCTYNRDLFEPETIERLLGHYQVLLESIVAAPHTPIGQLTLLPPTERHQLLMEWNQTVTDYPAEQCIHQLFEVQAEKTPDAVAVVFGEQQLSYGELNAQANQLAHYLQQHGVEGGDLVGICVERSVEMVVGLLGILKVGGAYVPLDPSYPQHRLDYMIVDANLSLLLTQQGLHHRLKELSIPSLCLDTLLSSFPTDDITDLAVSSTAEHRAYLMYTSGSTGQPKGVGIRHRSVVRLVKNTNYLPFNSEERFLQLAPISFDAATLEIWGSLLNGAQLVIMPPESPSLSDIAQIIKQHQITTVWLTAGLFHLMVDEQLEGLKPLKYLLAGGDVLSVPAVQTVLNELEGCQLINGYGPTENTTFTCCCPITSASVLHPSVPIGKPISNTQVYILDAYFNPVPIGVPGELHLGGDGLAIGYHNRPELTAEKFISDPFSDEPDARLYKTGDLVRYRPDGTIEFLGRIDHQVKIRGFRIETGEIETTLTQHPLIKEAVVVVYGQESDKKLIAYLITQPSPYTSSLSSGTLMSEVRQFIKERLPDYMVPAAFIALNELPLTPNGKIDRKALPAPEFTSLETEYVAPRTPTEQAVADIWATVLNFEKIGVNDNFFDLGGHSLLAIALMAELEKRFGRSFPLVTLFKAPTLQEFADMVQGASGDNAPSNSLLVPIQPKGTKPPFFCFPGGGGNVIYFSPLAKYLNPEQPFYGVQAVGLDGESEPQTRIDDMAARYIEEIRSVQPHGPYFLGGHSLGGKVVFEVAQQLLQQGESIALLVILDTTAPENKPGATDYMDEWDDAMWIAMFVHLLELLFQKELELPYEKFQGLPLAHQLDSLSERLQRVNVFPSGTASKNLRGFFNVFKANMQLAPSIPDQVTPAPITLFRSQEEQKKPVINGFEFTDNMMPDNMDDPLWGWGAFASGPVEVYQIPGDHVTMMTEPHVRVLAQRLNQCLEKAHDSIREH